MPLQHNLAFGRLECLLHIVYSIHLENGFWQSIGTGEGVVNTFRGTGEIYVQSLNLQTFAGLLNRCLPKRS